MPVALVRAHTDGASTSAGTTIAATVATADVAAGNLLAAWVGGFAGTFGARTAVAVSGLSKPGGESATWTKVGAHPAGAVSGELWVIKTTVPWPVGTVVTATFAATADRRAVLLAEFSGVDAVVRGPAGTGSGTSGTASAAVSSGLLTGDLVLGGGSQAARDFFDVIALDTDTTNGAWSEVDQSGLRTGFGDGSGLTLSLQAKVITASGVQTFNVVTANDTVGLVTRQGVGAVVVALRNSNVAPNAPTLTSLASGGTIDRAAVNRASHVFSDPNAGDSQSAFDLRYRVVGDPTWTTINQPVPNQFYDFPASSLAAGDYERQVRTYDAMGLDGPWSPSGFFTAADAPAGPSITDPINGSTVEASDTVTWSTANQDAYQVRRVADDAGDPDTGTVYFDTGEVVDAGTRTIGLTFAVNNRAEHVQVRVKYASLWSPWVSVAVDVSYTPPPVPEVVLSVDSSTASLLVTITNPAPEGADPAAAYNEVWIDDGAGEERKATGLSTSTAWRYWTPISGRDYATAVRVVAVASNGTTASST